MPTKAKEKRGRAPSKAEVPEITIGQLERQFADYWLEKLGLPESAFIEAKTEIGSLVLDKNSQLKGYSKAKILKWIKNAN